MSEESTSAKSGGPAWFGLAVLLIGSVGACNWSTPDSPVGGRFGGGDARSDLGEAGNGDAAYVSDRRAGDVGAGDARRDGMDAPTAGPFRDGGAASPDTGNGAPIGGPACEMCEQKECRNVDDADHYAACFLTTGVATEGRARGTSKRVLCLAVLECARRNGCALGDPQVCWCGEGVGDIQCLNGSAVGPCRTQVEDAAETTNPEMIAARLANPEYAIGAAFNLMSYCDQTLCRSPCFGLPSDAGADREGNGSGDVLVDRTGGPGGQGGGGGGGGGGSGGAPGGTDASSDGGSAGDGGGERGPVTYLQCRMCELTHCSEQLAACEGAIGNAAAGPRAGTPVRDLCLSVVACMRATRCAAETDVMPCYCGTAMNFACLTGGAANGPCKAEFEAAAESTDSTEVAMRFTDLPFASVYGRELAVCDYEHCNDPCTNGDTGATFDAGADLREGGGGAEAGEVAGPIDGSESPNPVDASDAALIGGAACNACEAEKCRNLDELDHYTPCHLATGLAVAGPAAGAPKKDLCLAVLDCARRNGCALADPVRCWCGTGVDETQCLSGLAAGPCKTEVERAAETTDPGALSTRLANPEYAIGAAFNLITYCDQPLCGAPCLGLPADAGADVPVDAPPDTPVDAPADTPADNPIDFPIDAAPDAPVDVAADVVPDTGAAEGGGDAGKTYVQCRMCELGYCPAELAACEDAVGVAAGGPRAGTPIKDLCLAVMACYRATRCAVNGDSMPCYCGTVADAACLGGSANGPCKAEVEAAAESTDPVVVATRFSDNPYALTYAYELSYCDFEGCNAPCTDGDSGSTPDGGGSTDVDPPDEMGGGDSSADAAADGAMPADASEAGGMSEAGKDGDTADGGDGGCNVTFTCADLDGNCVADCEETLVSNSTFGANASSWLPEYGVTQAWDGARDGKGDSTSGAIAVSNDIVVATDGLTMAGSRQCVPVAGGAAFELIAQVFIAGGQGTGSAGLSVYHFTSADCSGPIGAVYNPAFVADTDAWRIVQGVSYTPWNARSMSLRLAVLKPFANQAFHAHFDNVLLKTQ